MRARFVYLSVACAVLAACSGPAPQASAAQAPQDGAPSAEVIYTNGRIYTVDEHDGWASSMAVRDGRLLAVGEESDMDPYRGASTQVVDLEGRMVMPGIHDAHSHPIEAAVQLRLECKFREKTLDAALAKIEACAKQAKPGAWIRGGGWDKGFFDGQPLPREILDRIAPDNPVFLMDWSYHNAWVNTRALQELGIGESTPDPAGGIIRRVAGSGQETGILVDNAAYLYQSRLPEYPLGDRVDALDWALRHNEELGITTVKDAIVTPERMQVYSELAKRDALRIHVKTSLTWKSASAGSHEEEIRQIDGRQQFATDMLDPNFAKIMLDGVIMQYTSALLTPYPANKEIGHRHTGELMLEPEQLARDVAMLDRKGLSVKIHATGDRAARVALDAIAAARRENGDSGLIHEIAHAGLVTEADIPRFKQLNVAAEMCPIVLYPVPGIDRAALVGKERMPAWRVNTLVKSGALVTYGSDWPVVPTANPWPSLEAMVTRKDPRGGSDLADYPEEAVDLPTAVRIFTRNGAVVNKVGDSSGTLERGKDADFVVLDRNLFEIPIADVSEVKVLMSVVRGKVLFDKRSAH